MKLIQEAAGNPELDLQIKNYGNRQFIKVI